MSEQSADNYEAARALALSLDPTAVLSTADRISALRRLHKAVLDHAGDLCRGVARDFGRRSLDTRTLELFPLLEAIDHAIAHLERWAKPKEVGTPLACWPAASEVRPEPLGRVFVISPWNFPILLALEPAVDAIAAGNVVLVRPSASTPETNAALVAVASAAGIPAILRIHTCSHRESDELVLCGAFDHIFYTGSASIGRHVMRQAANNLTPVTLELGGKSPVIVAQDADLHLTAERLAWGRMTNAGQICIAPDYVLCERGVVEEVVRKTGEVIAQRLGIESVSKMNMHVAETQAWTIRIINNGNTQRLMTWTEEAKAAGAQVVCGGQGDASRRIMLPTIIKFDSIEQFASVKLGQDEIFGPIIPIVPVDSVDEAITFINARPKPLALYCFTRNIKTARHIADSTRSGSFMANDLIGFMANLELPFGGVGASGQGQYHGIWGFNSLSHNKTRVFRSHQTPGMADPRLARHAGGAGRVCRGVCSFLNISHSQAMEDDQAVWGVQAGECDEAICQQIADCEQLDQETKAENNE